VAAFVGEHVAGDILLTTLSGPGEPGLLRPDEAIILRVTR
jgi:alpha-glucosidase